MNTAKPTMQMYTFVQDAFDFFNDRLFAGKLPPCLLTLQREKNAMGYFSSNRWQGGSKQVIHEIALNPSFFITHNPLELMQTLVHEMVHLWQHEFGKPSHRAYHNKEWADKMESIGLMPSDTGEPGGKRTGQRMSDYPIEGGAFYLQCVVFAKMGYKLPFYDRYAKKDSSQIRHAAELMQAIQTEAFLLADNTAEIPTLISSLPYGDNENPPDTQQEGSKFDEQPLPESDTVNTTTETPEDSAAAASLLRPLSEQFDIDAVKLCEQREKEANAKRKTVYRCQSCGDRAWGKPTLNLWCGKCQIPFVRLDESYAKNELEEFEN